jgi:hypothetical protein
MSVTVTPLQIASLTVTPLRVALAPGPSEHGALSGLGDDDHPQYFDAARGDARYAPLSHSHVLTALDAFAPPSTYTFDTPLLDPAALGASEPKFSICGSAQAFGDGPGGETDYTDHVVSLGWNTKAPTAQDIAGVPGLCMTLESKRYDAEFQSRFQLRGIRPDGTQFHPFAGRFSHDGSGCRLGFKTQLVSFGLEATGANPETTNVVEVRPDAALATAKGIIQVDLPYANVHGAWAYGVRFAAATNAEQGIFRGFGNSNWSTYAQIVNIGSGAGRIDIGVTGAAAAYFHLFQAGSQEWAVGKRSDNNFEIAAGSAPGSNTSLLIDKTTLQAKFTAAPKLPSYTVAGLPSAATMGAGALAYVSDASGGPTLACSDGSTWRVIAALGATVS